MIVKALPQLRQGFAISLHFHDPDILHIVI